jgi:hypothetical protein
MRISILSITLIFLFASFTFSQNYPSFPIGQYWQFPDARSLSLGGGGSVSLNSPAAILYNPAALTQIDHFAAGQFSLSLRKLEERRSYPLYDRFSGIIGDGIYAVNDNWFSRPQGALAIRLPLKGIPAISLAAGSFTEVDQNYKYLEEVRQNIFGDSLEAYNRIDFTGALQRYSFAGAATLPFLPKLSLGVQAGILKGSLAYKKQIDFVKATEADILSSADRKLENTPLVLSFGGVYRVNERISAGADVSLPYTVKYSATNESGEMLNEEIGYPMKVTGAFEYRARQELQARLNVDFTYEFWSNVTYSGSGASENSVDNFGNVVPYTWEFSDVFDLKAGIEHIFYNQIPLRVGMQYRNSFRDKNETQTLLGAGTGYLASTWRLDVAGAFSRNSYRWPDLFDDALFGGNRSGSPIDNVEESYFFGQITFTYFLNLGK